MNLNMISKDTDWWFFTLPAFLGSKNLLDPYLIFSLLVSFLSLTLLAWVASPGGPAWKNNMTKNGPVPIPGPRGLPFIGSLFSLSRGLAHQTLAHWAWSRSRAATQLMAFSLGSTPAVVASDPHIAKEILNSPFFADRPIKLSAKSLMFSRAIGFAPNGAYWRLLRKISSSHLFAPRRILAYEPLRRLECAAMVRRIAAEHARNGAVVLRGHLQDAALRNILGSVFGKSYDPAHVSGEMGEVKEMVREGFELLGAFNWCDYVPWLRGLWDPLCVVERCEALVPRVRKFVKGIIDEHKVKKKCENKMGDNGDFVDVLLSLDGDEKLHEDDMIAVLWVSNSFMCIFTLYSTVVKSYIIYFYSYILLDLLIF